MQRRSYIISGPNLMTAMFFFVFLPEAQADLDPVSVLASLPHHQCLVDVRLETIEIVNKYDTTELEGGLELLITAGADIDNQADGFEIPHVPAQGIENLDNENDQINVSEHVLYKAIGPGNGVIKLVAWIAEMDFDSENPIHTDPWDRGVGQDHMIANCHQTTVKWLDVMVLSDGRNTGENFCTIVGESGGQGCEKNGSRIRLTFSATPADGANRPYPYDLPEVPTNLPEESVFAPAKGGVGIDDIQSSITHFPGFGGWYSRLSTLTPTQCFIKMSLGSLRTEYYWVAGEGSNWEVYINAVAGFFGEIISGIGPTGMAYRWPVSGYISRPGDATLNIDEDLAWYKVNGAAYVFLSASACDDDILSDDCYEVDRVVPLDCAGPTSYSETVSHEDQVSCWSSSCAVSPGYGFTLNWSIAPFGEVFRDRDNDGFLSGEDCDDWNPARTQSWATERCDGIDNDCDGLIDEDNLDSDGDGFADCIDIDDDQDFVPDAEDNCPMVANGDQLDRDEDGRGDVCDRCQLDPLDDADRDTVCADVDNCPALWNRNQADLDTDHIGDACDDDIDGDGLWNEEDLCPYLVQAVSADGDSDGVGDPCDNCPNHANSDQKDWDRDGDGDVCDLDDDNDGVLDENDNCPFVKNPEQEDCLLVDGTRGRIEGLYAVDERVMVFVDALGLFEDPNKLITGNPVSTSALEQEGLVRTVGGVMRVDFSEVAYWLSKEFPELPTKPIDQKQDPFRMTDSDDGP